MVVCTHHSPIAFYADAQAMLSSRATRAASPCYDREPRRSRSQVGMESFSHGLLFGIIRCPMPVDEHHRFISHDPRIMS
jgi:hypothetical protein